MHRVGFIDLLMNKRDALSRARETAQSLLKKARENVKLGKPRKDEKERVQNYDGRGGKKKKRKSMQKALAKHYGGNTGTVRWKCPEKHVFDTKEPNSVTASILCPYCSRELQEYLETIGGGVYPRNDPKIPKRCWGKPIPKNRAARRCYGLNKLERVADNVDSDGD